MQSHHQRSQLSNCLSAAAKETFFAAAHWTCIAGFVSVAFAAGVTGVPRVTASSAST
jgi:hypothetical protein